MGSADPQRRWTERPEGFGKRATRWTLQICPECGRDGTSCLDRALVYHWAACDYHKAHPWAGEPVEVVPAVVAERLAGALREVQEYLNDSPVRHPADMHEAVREALSSPAEGSDDG